MNLQQRDLKHIWHPCSQMKRFETFPLLPIVNAEGVYLHLADGRKVIDAISSWWCKTLGHGHPRLRQALNEQAELFEHVILADTTNEVIVNLAEQLAKLSPSLNKMTFASDGSCAIEIAIKLSFHSRLLRGETQRNKIMALSNGYHGETLMALACSDLGYFRQPYNAILPTVEFLQHIPYVCNSDDPLWENCETYWPAIEAQLNQHSEQLTAIIIEPILQGSGQMRIYSKDFLIRLREWTKQHNVHLIADEILTGLGRTGLPLACHHAAIEPDFLCLSKGLTAGWIPFSVTITSEAIYQLFYGDEPLQTFYHSHTFTGNALGARLALTTLAILEEENIYQKAQALQPIMFTMMQELAEKTKVLTNVRGIGGVVAADLTTPGKSLAQKVFRHAMAQGALLRPLINTLYWFPPLNIEHNDLIKLRDITYQAIMAAVKEN